MADAAPSLSPAAPPRAKLSGIEALRGLAALAVLLYHAARHVNAAYGMPTLMAVFQSGHAGVDLFFTLSGFLILHVHDRDIGRAERIGRYARQRITRVMPLYWIALGLTVIKGAGAHGMPPVGSLIHSALLLPGWEEPLLGPAWSLQHELLFYVVFAVLILHRRAGLTLLGLWSAVIAAGACGAFGDHVPFQIIGHYNLEFFLGMGAALLLPRVRLGTGLTIAGALLLGCAGLAESIGYLDGLGLAARLCYGVPSALLILGCAAMRAPKIPRWLATLGSASYSLYLFQFLFMGLTVKGWQVAGLDRSEWGGMLFVLMVVTGIAGGIATTRWVEKPLLRWMRRDKDKAVSRQALQA
jgi:peptidoglycan/LPS O-acetylase OafA/YrhL